MSRVSAKLKTQNGLHGTQRMSVMLRVPFPYQLLEASLRRRKVKCDYHTLIPKCNPCLHKPRLPDLRCD